MSDAVVRDVRAWEVLDSRGDPTVRVAVETGTGRGVFTVPAGASTGRHEAVERRDGGSRYGGRGVREAVQNVEETLARVVVGRDVTDQAAIDAALVERDGSDDLSRLGANAVLGVSGAVAHAASATLGRPLYETLADGDGSLPTPMVNVLSGGLHAEGGLDVQDFLVLPTAAETYPDALELVWRVRTAVRDRIVADGHRPLVADEGGFAPPLDDVAAAFELLSAGVRDAGLTPGEDVHFAVDVAASHFYDGERDAYVLEHGGRSLTSEEMVAFVEEWVDRWPVVSIEDPLAEDDWDAWTALTDAVGGDVQILGDDLLVTNEARLERSISAGAANAVLVKPNQAGTVTRAIEVIDAARANDVAPVVSARSGETCDTTIADLAVARDAGQIKIGSLVRSERTAKYNRLLAIDGAPDSVLARPACVTRAR